MMYCLFVVFMGVKKAELVAQQLDKLSFPDTPSIIEKVAQEFQTVA
jgi:hypothetical protein